MIDKILGDRARERGGGRGDDVRRRKYNAENGSWTDIIYLVVHSIYPGITYCRVSTGGMSEIFIFLSFR